MTELLYYRDPYARETAARVLAADEHGLVLDRTVCYVRGGGQPGDRARLRMAAGEVAVTDTLRGPDGRPRHVLPADAGMPAPGERVTVSLDWPRRHRHMRVHTALHLLVSLIPAGVTGGAIGEAEGRLDFDAADLALDVEALTAGLRALVAADHPVRVEYVDETLLDQRPELVRTMSVQPPRGTGQLRMVRIGEDVDYQPCGGTHVARTGEIGPVRVTAIRSKGRRNRRVTLALEAP
ncbi:alanyl-tRNA editing protein [Spiribacter halobius]|uniref:Ala-tRNA(Pro) hydrolase n=1 Tax=Sediminicurvatus halobius TaxID=2182432 RepID=A0A2U2MYG5_9GAMM|nr:alanyl-tRNA editing protein [Spiribacter halobius]PWG62055.1 Ala-tRNA(Pro) hydrolase [Spiribacter halobius]UEX78676.1 alanyl-tRNA editing protein [Spiribacter halobius]